MLDSLDFVIGVDTAVTHLAATQGVPTWLLLPLCADWRWGARTNGGQGSPWYPSLRIFQQTKLPDLANPANSWAEVVSKAATELERGGMLD